MEDEIRKMLEFLPSMRKKRRKIIALKRKFSLSYHFVHFA